MKDIVGQEVVEGSFITYATKTEAPSLQFGWVEQVKVTETEGYDGQTRQSVRIKVHHANSDGSRKNKTVFKKLDAPLPPDETGYVREWDYVDTGRPSTVWLDGTTGKSNRLLVVKPF